MIHPVAKPMSFLDWIGQWHMTSAISPSAARSELFRLGHVEDGRRRSKDSKKRRRRTVPTGADYSAVMIPSQEIRVLVLGSRASGKTALLNCLCGVNEVNTSFEASPLETTSTTKPETTQAYVKLKKRPVVKGGKVDDDGEEFAVHLLFTEVPEADPKDADKQKEELKGIIGTSAMSKNRSFDLVLFAFDSTKEESLSYAKEMETALLTDDIPRAFVATKEDLPHPTVLKAALGHCKELDLEPPLLTSATESMLGDVHESATKARTHVLECLAKCCLEESGLDQLRSRPHAEKKRKEAAKRRKMLWLGGLVSVSVAVAVGVGVLWRGVGKGERRGGWLRHIFGGGLVRGMSSAQE
jgi:GTPase SAR1 family protein